MSLDTNESLKTYSINVILNHTNDFMLQILFFSLNVVFSKFFHVAKFCFSLWHKMQPYVFIKYTYLFT